MYAIICDARKGENLGISHLALVDRTKRKDLWWVSDNPSSVMDFKKYDVAKRQLKRLKYNNARIVHVEKAKEILESQSRSISEVEEERLMEEAMDSAEMGWDAHKMWTGTGD
jgi:hypothetical protein